MVNKCIIEGRLTKDPEYTITKNEKALCTFTIAWNEKIGGFKNTLFLDCISWGKNADMVAKYFVKGQAIVVCGKLITNMWNGKDGKSYQRNKLSIEDVQFSGWKIGNSDDVIEEDDGVDGFTEIDGEDLDIPF